MRSQYQVFSNNIKRYWFSNGLYAALKPYYPPRDLSASLSSTNPLSERSSQTHSKVCLCTKNSTTIYCNQTLCMGRGTWGALCVLLPCGEIAVNTFPLLSALVGSGKQPRSVHYPPIPHWEEHHATFTTPHLLPSAVQRAWRKWLFSLYCAFLAPYLAFSFISVFCCCTKPGVREQIGFYSCSRIRQ